MKAENILEVRDMQTTFKLYEGLLKAVNHVDLTVRTARPSALSEKADAASL